MMVSCPHCGSTDLIEVEIGEVEHDSLYECETCGEQFNGDEIVGNEYEGDR